MSRVRALVHLVTGETVDVSRSVGISWGDEGEALVQLDGVELPAEIEAADVLVTLGRQVVEFRAERWRSEGGVLDLHMRRYAEESHEIHPRGVAEVERTFANLVAFLDRLVRNGWSDRATGKLAPKLTDVDDAETGADDDEDERSAA